jgi:hypothetical protein
MTKLTRFPLFSFIMSIQDFPARLTDLIERGWVEIHPAVDIYFSDDTSVHWSTTNIVVDGVTYVDRLSRVNTVKDSLSRSIDRAEIVLDNADLVVGDTLLDDDAEDILDNLPAVYYQIYVNIEDRTEIYKIERMSGVVYTFSEEGMRELNMTILSDAYAGGGIAPYEVRQNCVWQYKDGINCDYSGTNTSCDLSFEGSNGCIAHFGYEMAKARFGGGAKDLDEDSRKAFEPFQTGDVGEVGNPNCFFGSTPVYVNSALEERPIREYEEEAGMAILGFDKSDFTPIDDLSRKPALKSYHREWFHLVFSDGAQFEGVTGYHPFFPKPGKRVLVKDFELGMKFRRLVNGKWRTVKLIKMEKVTSMVPTPFYNVPVTSNQDYFANGFPVSNLKNLPGDLPYLGWHQPVN